MKGYVINFRENPSVQDIRRLQYTEKELESNERGEVTDMKNPCLDLPTPRELSDIDRLKNEKAMGIHEIKSDGGSSSYYDFYIPGRGFMKTETIIKWMVGNDFDYGNIVKAVRRIHMKELGTGKAGIDAKYDWYKIKYTAEKRIRMIEDGES